jgi:hypothetical protein
MSSLGTWLTHGEWVMSILTFIYVVFSILSWVRIGHQWTAMKDSNEISRKNLEAVQRAFVFLTQTEILADMNRERQITGYRFRATWENSGTTPTRQLAVYLAMIGTPRELPKSYAFPDFNKMECVPLALGPKAILWSKDLPISTEVLHGAYNGSLHLYVCGGATYRDVFDDTPQHVTKFCLKIMVQSDPRTGTPKIAMDSHFEHNCADEDC